MTTFHITLIYFCALLLLALMYAIALHRQRKATASALALVRLYCDNLNRLKERLNEFNSKASSGEAYIVHSAPLSQFHIVRDGLIIKTINYNPADPDDFDYKRIHAEEVAEKLNEKP